ncbi:MAG: sigma 54-interacting transcriptional regulator [Planctomycetota bacterium]
MPDAMTITNVETGRSSLIERTAVIGRQADCEVVLSDTLASRRHATLFRRDDGYYIRDLNSRNHTFVNGRETHGAIRLKHGDEIRIGNTRFSVALAPGEEKGGPGLSDDKWSRKDALAYETISPLDYDIVRDVTEHSSGASRHDLQRRLALFAEISNGIRRLRRTGDLLHEVVRQVRRVFPAAKRCLVVMKDAASGELAVRAYDGEPGEETAGVRISRTLLRNVLRAGEAVMSANPLTDAALDTSESLTKYHLHSFLCAPIAVSGQFEGAIFLDAVDKKHRFSRDDLSLLTLISNELSLAIENAEILDRICRERDSLAVERASLQEEARRCDFSAIIGSSKAIRQAVDLARRAAGVESTILITGESGAGKELLARAIHHNSKRGDGPFLSMNCAAIARELVESEIFGHEKGAFTGATESKPGLFESAAGGSLLLDEIGDMPLDTQAKILKVLEEKEVRRVGGRETIPVDVRLMAATNKDLEAEAKAGRFREDLFYRLNVLRINAPPLRERREDILPLADHYLRVFAAQMHKTITGFTPAAVEAMQQYPWPGNIRELKNMIERVVLEIGDERVVDVGHLPIDAGESLAPPHPAREGALQQLVEAYERQIILNAIERSDGNKSKAARLLGLSRQGLLNKLDRYGIGE